MQVKWQAIKTGDYLDESRRTKGFAERRYEVLRQIARGASQTIMFDQSRVVLRLEPFTAATFQYVQKIWTPRGRKVDWDWAGQFVYWRRRRPTRWDLALWAGNDLLGLALGYPSKHGKTILYLEGIERFPGDRKQVPLASVVVPLILGATHRYAQSIKSRKIVIVNPHPKVMAGYEAAGYRVAFVSSLRRYAPTLAVEVLCNTMKR